MTGESGGGHRTPEPTFADVMNGFSFDSGRSAKRRRWGRRGEDERPAEAVTPNGRHAAESIGRFDLGTPEEPHRESVPSCPSTEPPSEQASASVRPYTWTRGRTRSGHDLRLETLVSTSSRGRDQLPLLAFEHRSVAELCENVHSVAEVAALLSVPLGVSKVLVGDMAGMGLVVVHRSGGSNGDAPDIALMERVLSGLRRL